MADETTSKAELFKALNQFHKNLEQPSKDGNNPFFKSGYVTLEGVQDAVDKALEGTGLSYFQMVFDDPSGNKAVNTVIAHESGATITMGALSLSPVKSDPQGYGSAITYAKRYQLAAAFGISSEKDDDANQATFNRQAPNKKQSSTNTRTKRSTSNSRQQKKQNPLQNLATEYKQKLQTAVQATGSTEKTIQKNVVDTCKSDVKGYAEFDRQQQLRQWIKVLDRILQNAAQVDMFAENN
ncbi:Erf family protein [Limosilactobacillus coleohominis 101-4-CHN]|uniref:Erf family protein n=1 Tax=Limosilactobacillus coleohominis 101-4-CHN TaxID=575594 RepID=C7XUW4_9LACO|nr:ERF family protein [Limosilactobacillus coleohominis]EEU31075.1 Erf family protein [Limosilactobacillus coleohominis 101-4-CHN]